MTSLSVLDSRAPALHALAYCQRLFYLDAVKEIGIADASQVIGTRAMPTSVMPKGVVHPANIVRLMNWITPQ